MILRHKIVWLYRAILDVAFHLKLGVVPFVFLSQGTGLNCICIIPYTYKIELSRLVVVAVRCN